jgi:hypothetical protein
MKMQPAHFGTQSFNIARIYDAEIDTTEGELIFEIELRLRHTNQQVFFGILTTPQAGSGSSAMEYGIGVSIDPQTGEVRDVVNGQGVIGHLELTPMEMNEATFLCIAAEKLNRIFIPKITVGEDKMLHPALHIERCTQMSLVVGTTDMSRGAIFENPHFVIARRRPSISA